MSFEAEQTFRNLVLYYSTELSQIIYPSIILSLPFGPEVGTNRIAAIKPGSDVSQAG